MTGLASVNWPIVTSLLMAGVTAIATAVLTFVTWVLAKETKRLADATSAPHVVVTLQPSPWSVIHTELVLQNAGTGTAYDIQVEIDPPLKLEKRGKSVSMPVRSLSLLKPGQSFPIYLHGFEKLNEQTFSISTSWLRRPGSLDREAYSYVLDLRSDYDEWGQLGGGPPDIQIARELKKIREDFGRLASGFSRLGVNVYDTDDRGAEERALEEAWGTHVEASSETPKKE